MPDLGTPSVEQLQVFLTVVDTGSFAAAGRRLNRATSVVSYAIGNLEFQLGTKLFDRESKKPALTAAGTAMLSEARAVSKSMDNLRARVRELTGGLEPVVAIAVDALLPMERLVDVMKAFGSEFSTVALRLYVESLGAITQLVHTGAASLGITGGIHVNVHGIERVGIGSVQLSPVAAPGHPLVRLKAPGAALNHVQLVLTDRSPLTEGQDFGVIGAKTWRLTDLGAKHALLLAGVGWGNMPEPMVRDDINRGRLVALHLPEFSGGHYDLQAIYRTDMRPGPAASWIIERFKTQPTEL
jgi:DNA-binding transcriptional LysR family regulator